MTDYTATSDIPIAKGYYAVSNTVENNKNKKAFQWMPTPCLCCPYPFLNSRQMWAGGGAESLEVNKFEQISILDTKCPNESILARVQG